MLSATLFLRSSPAPSKSQAAYYAHLAAFRGRLMKREYDEGSVVSSGSGDRAPEVLQIPDSYANQVSLLVHCSCHNAHSHMRLVTV